MEQEYLQKRIEFAEGQIEFLSDLIANSDPANKNYLQIVQCYDDWVSYKDREEKKLENLDSELDDKEEEKEYIRKKDKTDLTLRYLELGCKVAVPILTVLTTVAIAKLSYASDADLKLCNGRIMGLSKDLIRTIGAKI